MLRTEEPFCKQQRVENEFEGKHCLMALNLALFADLGFLNEEEKSKNMALTLQTVQLHKKHGQKVLPILQFKNLY